jgi:hypothetical protein
MLQKLVRKENVKHTPPWSRAVAAHVHHLENGRPACGAATPPRYSNEVRFTPQSRNARSLPRYVRSVPKATLAITVAELRRNP